MSNLKVLNTTPVGSNNSNEVIIDIEKVEEKIGTFVTSEGNKDIQIITKDMLKGMLTSENVKKIQDLVVKFTDKNELVQQIEGFLGEHFQNVFKDGTTESEAVKSTLANALRKVMKGKENDTNIDVDKLSDELVDKTGVELQALKLAFIDSNKDNKGGFLDKILHGMEVFIDGKIDEVIPDEQGRSIAKRVVSWVVTAAKWVPIPFTFGGSLGGAVFGFLLNSFLNSTLTSAVPNVTTWGWNAILILPPIVGGAALGGTIDLVRYIILCVNQRQAAQQNTNSQQTVQPTIIQKEAPVIDLKKVEKKKLLINEVEKKILEKSSNNLLVEKKEEDLVIENKNEEELKEENIEILKEDENAA